MREHHPVFSKDMKKIKLYIIGIAATITQAAAAQATWNVQLRSNAIYDLALCPNIGVALQHQQWEANIDWIGAWWNHDYTHHYYSNYAIQAEIRHYLLPQEKKHYLGPHLGIYAQLATYDFEFGGTGYQATKLTDSFGVGVAYGYQIQLTQDLNLDLNAGIGFFHTQYDRYIPGKRDRNYYKTQTRNRNFIAPTKLEATLVWKLNQHHPK